MHFKTRGAEQTLHTARSEHRFSTNIQWGEVRWSSVLCIVIVWERWVVSTDYYSVCAQSSSFYLSRRSCHQDNGGWWFAVHRIRTWWGFSPFLKYNINMHLFFFILLCFFLLLQLEREVDVFRVKLQSLTTEKQNQVLVSTSVLQEHQSELERMKLQVKVCLFCK